MLVKMTRCRIADFSHGMMSELSQVDQRMQFVPEAPLPSGLGERIATAFIGRRKLGGVTTGLRRLARHLWVRGGDSLCRSCVRVDRECVVRV